jgi:hypothetical protein
MMVETAMPYLTEKGASTITPEQIEGACWSAITHEARGIVLFQHNNDGINGNYSLVESPLGRLERIHNIIQGIHTMAPVLNTQSYKWDFGSGTDAMLKIHNGAAYIFASNALGAEPGVHKLSLPPSLPATHIEVIGENRTIPVYDSAFADDFKFEYSHHIYKFPHTG